MLWLCRLFLELQLRVAEKKYLSQGGIFGHELDHFEMPIL